MVSFIRENCIWIKVTDDAYELPVLIADSASELAELAGVSPNTIYASVHFEKYKKFKSRYKKVVIDCDDGGVNGSN